MTERRWTEGYWKDRALAAEAREMILRSALSRLEAVIECDTLSDEEVDREIEASLQQARSALEMPSSEVVRMTN